MRWTDALPNRPAVAVLTLGGAAALAGMFHSALPLWLAGTPLLAAIAAGTPSARAAGMAAFLLGPALAVAWGLRNLGIPDAIVWPGAAAVVISVSASAAAIGAVPTSVALSLVPFNPASPLLPLAAALPGSGLAGPGTAIALLAVAERRGTIPRRVITLGSIVAAALWNTTIPPPPEARSGWREVAEPPTLTPLGRILALRRLVPPGGGVILGENSIDAGDKAALSLLCDTATERNATIHLGVRAPDGHGLVWRINPQGCARETGSRHTPVHAAHIGIPGLTGGMLPTPSPYPPDPAAPGHWMVCLEGFLPWSWLPLLARPVAEPVIVIANDRATAPLPVPALRRKATRAMARLAGLETPHADTGHNILVRAPSEQSP